MECDENVSKHPLLQEIVYPALSKWASCLKIRVPMCTVQFEDTQVLMDHVSLDTSDRWLTPYPKLVVSEAKLELGVQKFTFALQKSLRWLTTRKRLNIRSFSHFTYMYVRIRLLKFYLTII